MALNTTQYAARKIRETFEQLNPENDPHKAVWLMSLDNDVEETKAGQMASAYVGHTRHVSHPIARTVFPAPRCIVEKTHRLATSEEIDQYLAAEAVKKAELDNAERARKTQMNINLQSGTDNAELMKLVLAMAEKMMAEKEGKTAKK